jgi:hypothetical protein
LSDSNVLHPKEWNKLKEAGKLFIREGPLQKINEEGKARERHFFLFSDFILYTKKAAFKKKGYAFKGKIDLRATQVRDIFAGTTGKG